MDFSFLFYKITTMLMDDYEKSVNMGSNDNTFS